MDRMIFISMSGASETMAAQAVNANNLANSTTTGFRADFQSSLSQKVYGPGYASRVYATAETPGVDYKQGSIISTGRELDMAINGDGWFAVQAADGSEGYSRRGDLQIDNAGRLLTGDGHFVLGNGGPVTIPPYAKLDIGADGTISIQPLGQSVNTLAIIDRIKMVNPPHEQISRSLDGLMRTNNGQAVVADADVRVVSGSLESSNVNTVEAMVRMIELARQYETHIKLMKAADENDTASAQMMRMS